MKIGLRHDIDTVYGLRRGLQKIIFIEKKYDVKSTFFIRIDVIESKKDIVALKTLSEDGWEIGLHLINTDDRPSLISPLEELEILKRYLETPIYGVTPCGSTIGWKEEMTWRVMDRLNLLYVEGYGAPNIEIATHVMPNHLSFDIHYVRNYGEELGYEKFKDDLLKDLNIQCYATVLTHPEWFVRTVGGSSLMKIPMTILRKKMMNKVYEKFLNEFHDDVEFLRYVDLVDVITK